MKEGRFTIITKFIPWTNTKPSRVQATCHCGVIRISHDGKESHDKAARQLLEMVYKEDAAHFDLVKAFITEGSFAFIVMEKQDG